MHERNDRLVTSSLTIGEVLVKPLEQGNVELQRQFELVLTQEAAIQDLTRASARRYAAIRLDRGIRPQDAIQLACAAEAGVDLFITNDERLSRKVVPGIQFITSLDR